MSELNYILDGQGHGSVAKRLMATGYDPYALRPFIGNDGRSYILHNTKKFDVKGQPIYKVLACNTGATLPKNSWIKLDEAVTKSARLNLDAVKDLRDAGLDLVIPNGMAKTVYEYQTQSDAGHATVSMSPLRRSNFDRPLLDLKGIPLPIIHSDFQFDGRELMVSQASGMPLNTTMAENAGRRCAEVAEQMLIGTYDTFTYANYSIYGYLTSPARNTKVITAPTAGGWTPATLLTELLAMKQQLIDDKKRGPYRLYVNTQWSAYLDSDYSVAKGDYTLRDRLLKLEKISSIKTLDYLPATNFRMLLVQMDSSTIQEIIGMDFSPVEWSEQGGWELNYKVLGIFVPLIRSDYYGNCGIVDAASA